MFLVYLKYNIVYFDRVEKKERARLKTVKFNSKTRGDKGVSVWNLLFLEIIKYNWHFHNSYWATLLKWERFCHKNYYEQLSLWYFTIENIKVSNLLTRPFHRPCQIIKLSFDRFLTTYFWSVEMKSAFMQMFN